MRTILTACLICCFCYLDADAAIFFRRRVVRRPSRPAPTRPADPQPDPVPQPVDDGNDNTQIDIDALVNLIIERIGEHSHPELVHEHEPVDYDRIQVMIDGAISEALAGLPEQQPPAQRHVVHFTVIASPDASYWSRIGPIIERAKEAYHRINVVDPPTSGPPIGALPQVVEYRDSIPQGTYFGRDAYETLERVARGTYPPHETAQR